ncbi:hypothetical protein A6770_22110 [Nostoc minutum NIES-26]|uniref:NodB homology domain-containing protein n=1 Tax=Nostoc minutum NIES-26 TaxID=1844469 RepID=A0A367QYY3_9NOSO|nr:hypothetical protein A6770_22110 [Nostoc minutum NIES-26]
MRSHSQTQDSSFFAPTSLGLLQRKFASCSQHSVTGGEYTERKNQQSLLQRRSTNQVEHSEIPPIVHEVLASPGQPLEASTRAFMESRFGHDFSRVRVHTDAKAAESAHTVNALAYAVGRDVVFGGGQYAPNTSVGVGLIAHELTHVLQQSQQNSLSASHNLRIGAADSIQEQQAESALSAISQGQPPPSLAPATPQLMRATRTFALTFDDGPHVAELGKGKNLTEKVLDVLKARGIKAGFFVQTGVSFRGGDAVGKQLIARMHAEGHKVGIHTGGTKDHELHTTAEKAGRLQGELDAAKKYIKEQTGEVPTLVRPPTGAKNQDVLATYKKVNLTNLMWDIDGDQGQNLALKTLKDRIESGISKVHAGGWKPSTASPKIVFLYHDIQRNTAQNLDTLIEHIKTTTKKISDNKDNATFAAP